MDARPRTRYPGAQPFADDELSRKLFFGREKEATALTHQILANRLVVLFARSGLGKTSLLNAGVAEKLRVEGLLPLTVRVNDVALGPLESVYRGIAASSAHQLVEYKQGDTASLWHFFKTAEFWREDLLLTPVLILDQFEELFTLQSERQRGKFIDQFSHLVRGVPPPMLDDQHATASIGRPSDAPPCVKIVVSLREDFVCELEELSDRIPETFNQRFRLLPLARLPASRAMEEPAGIEDSNLATRPFEFDPGGRELILDFLTRRAHSSIQKSSSDVEPFQLQLICQRVEEIVDSKQRQGVWSGGKVTLKEIGGKSGLGRILKEFYTSQLGVLPSHRQRRRAKRLCSLYLISPQGRRLQMEESEIKRHVGVNSDSLQKLVDRRLLRVNQTTEGTYYELSHDSLIKPVLASRRAYIWLRGAGGLMLTLIGAGLCVYFLILFIEEAISGKETAYLFGFGAASLMFVAIFWGIAVRNFGSFMDMLRRLKILRRA